MKTFSKITLAASLAAFGLALPAASQVGSSRDQEKDKKERPAQGGDQGAERGGVGQAPKKEERPKEEKPAAAGGEQRAAGQGGGRARQEGAGNASGAAEEKPTERPAGANAGTNQGANEAQGGVETRGNRPEARAGEARRAAGEGEQNAEGRSRAAREGEPGQGEARQRNAEGRGAAEEPGAGAGAPGAAAAERRLTREEAQEFLRRLAEEENLHREHMARIERLQQISRDGKDETRGREVADLLAAEKARHEKALAQMERHVGPENFRRGVQKLKEAAKTKGPGAKGNENARGAERPADARGAAEKPAERAAGGSEQKPGEKRGGGR